MNCQPFEDRAAVLLKKQKALALELQTDLLPEKRALEIEQELTVLYEEQAKIARTTAGVDGCSVSEMELNPSKGTLEVLSGRVLQKFYPLCPSCNLKLEENTLLIDSENSDDLRFAQDRWYRIAKEANDLGIGWVRIGGDTDGFPAVIAEAYFEEV